MTNVVSLSTLKEKGTEEILENVDVRYVLRCILKLSSTEVEIYKVLQDKVREPMTVAEIAKAINKSRSTVERSLIKLVQLGLVTRRPVLARNGGYTYVYYTKSIEYVRQKLLKLLETYYEKSRQLVENLTTASLLESIGNNGEERREEAVSSGEG